ncbi:lanosterol synthase [Trypanosoma rangeli]|uniref:Lanosterol synthase n=1 Tax=Trypanosoma rangeli TaxID=5698 RepID=A0A3R7KVQ6_TRYRA|nr:lanosterol synthase [Trypanosoma rangeli]RNF02318.1 lanosterol synthase [Trypanosoma rangeli]|eukprot:RNF02318.1 lanosterol synthase [Trypanosoma rangeli]
MTAFDNDENTLSISHTPLPMALPFPFQFESVVPRPPSTVWDYVLSLLWMVGKTLGLFLFLLFSAPVLLLLHWLLMLLDRRNRRAVLRHQQLWSFKSVPHVRPVRVAASREFPLENWHLRCEDGRQRWCYGELLNEEEGNTLGKMQAAGLAFFPSRDVPMVGEHYEWAAGNAVSPTQEPDMRAIKEKRRRFVEQYQLGLKTTVEVRRRASSEDAVRDGVEFLLQLQDPYSGHWPNDYSGPLFLTPGLIFVKFLIAGGDLHKMFLPHKDHHHKDDKPCCCGEAARLELIRYLRNYINKDGGFGQHTEGHSTMLGTVLNYVALRLMGVPAEDADAAGARAWIRGHGGAVSIPTWGKVWLCIVGLYSWDGINPIPPELSLLPNWVPLSQGRLWCHSRVVSVPFSYLYGTRWTPKPHPLLRRLRQELYTEPYHQISWEQHQSNICKLDCYTPLSSTYKFTAKMFKLYEKLHSKALRRYALEVAWSHIAYEDEDTNFICLGPVNKLLDMLITWIREGESSGRYQNHLTRVDDYLYMGPEGMRMSGYNGSQLWDTSFAVQAICAGSMELLYPQEMDLAHHYVDIAQVRRDPKAAASFYRHRTKGAWNFSTATQSWQVSDCTAEGLRVILLLRHRPFSVSRMRDAVDEILSLRNKKAGWASYEPMRAPAYAELFNAADVFKDVMTDYGYAECSSSCIHTLALFRQHYPGYRRTDVNTAIREGIQFVLSLQRPDGSFYGSWGVCFTYAAWLVASALCISREIADMANHPSCVRLIDFLLSHQNADGGWGEDVTACMRSLWVDSPSGSQVVNTAWAVMAIMSAAGEAARVPPKRREQIRVAVERGIHLIMSRQLVTGDWAQERISGVFNGNNPINYPGYKNTMPVWALGAYNAWKKTYTVPRYHSISLPGAFGLAGNN